VSSPLSECASYHQQGHAGSKNLLHQNPLVLNWGCRITQVVLYNGHKMVVVLVIPFYNDIHALFVQFKGRARYG